MCGGGGEAVNFIMHVILPYVQSHPQHHSLQPHTHSLPSHSPPTPHSLPQHTHHPPHTHSHPTLTTSFLCKTASQSIALNHLCCFTSSTPCCRKESGQNRIEPGQWIETRAVEWEWNKDRDEGARTAQWNQEKEEWNQDRESVEWNHQMDSLVTNSNSNDTSWNQFGSHYYLRQYLGQISCQYYNIGTPAMTV